MTLSIWVLILIGIALLVSGAILITKRKNDTPLGEKDRQLIKSINENNKGN